jgi:ERCC4-type nuclease
MKIRIDTRELELIRLCKHFIETGPMYNGLHVIVEPLPIGDVILSDNNAEYDKIIIERKSLGDLACSIKDGRYEEQSYRLNGLSHHNHNIYYLIEGDMNRLNATNSFKDRIDKTSLYSAMFSLNYYKGFSVLRSMNIEESALIICNLAYKLNKSPDKNAFYSNIPAITNASSVSNLDEDGIDNQQTSSSNTSYCGVIKKVKKENITPENIGEIMLCQIPGISSTSAVAIMKEYKTIHNLIAKINENEKCLHDISYINTKGQTRKINKTVIANIIKYLQK